eukprot:Lithocolla_globosa_v1_NODE_1552_length_2491_cov_65.954023.p3 type:complete len:105 gc:universal NODE_1552_length_2491_cov_65.954023:109-423(+)
MSIWPSTRCMYSFSIKASMPFLMSGMVGLKRGVSCEITSSINRAWGYCFRIFIVRTIAAWMRILRSSWICWFACTSSGWGCLLPTTLKGMTERIFLLLNPMLSL